MWHGVLCGCSEVQRALSGTFPPSCEGVKRGEPQVGRRGWLRIRGTRGATRLPWARPDWLGIGVTRAGTTWFTALLTQHPQVDLPGGIKELQMLQREHLDLDEYCQLFAEGDRTGEFSPRYMRSLNSIARVRAVLPHDAPVLVLLRDPVDRFESVMRLRGQRGKWPFPPALSDHIWAGMYADQLDLWAAALGRHRLLVFQFEAVRRDPQPALDRVWRMLGLDPVAVRETDRTSKNDSRHSWEWPEGLREHLISIYAPQVQRLTSEYGIDPTLWKNFACRLTWTVDAGSPPLSGVGGGRG